MTRADIYRDHIQHAEMAIEALGRQIAYHLRQAQRVKRLHGELPLSGQMAIRRLQMKVKTLRAEVAAQQAAAEKYRFLLAQPAASTPVDLGPSLWPEGLFELPTRDMENL